MLITSGNPPARATTVERTIACVKTGRSGIGVRCVPTPSRVWMCGRRASTETERAFFTQPGHGLGRCRRDVSARTRGLEASSPSPTRHGAGARKTGQSVISGECRVETIPFGADAPGGRKLAIDGLRLRLDLKIVPNAAGSGDAAAAAIWRIENARLATLPLGILASYRTLAVAAGLGAMLLALGVWFVGAPAESTTMVGASEPSAARVAPAAPANPALGNPALPDRAPANAAPVGALRTTTSPESSASPRLVSPVSGAPGSGGASSLGVPAVSALAGSSVPEVPSGAVPTALPTAAPAPVSAVPSVAPRIAIATDNGAAPATAAAVSAGSTDSERAVRAPRDEPARPPRPASSQPANAGGATLAGAADTPPTATAPATRTRRPAPPAASGPTGASDDMLDLFGDPK